MKKVLVLSMFAASCFAGDLYQHVQLPLLDTYMDSSVDQDPDLPGMGTARYFVSVSIATQDAQASAFGIYFRVRLEDGTEHPVKVIIERKDSGATCTTQRFFVGNVKPVKIV